MRNKQLIIVIEGTSAMASYWTHIVSDYLDQILRCFCTDDMVDQNFDSSVASGSTFELALVVFNAHGPHSAFLIQRSGWTKDVNQFLAWLSTLSFSGGESNDVATAEGLAEALMMFAIPQAQQISGCERHCILVSASNPYPFPTSVYRPAMEQIEQEHVLYDVETVSTWFGQCSVSLSVICPKQLPKLRAIYNAAKRKQGTSEPAVQIKQPDFLVLVSDSFSDACAALSNRSCTFPINQLAQRIQHVDMNSSTSNMMPMPKQGSSESKYVKIWEGSLFVNTPGQPVFISKLESYRNATASQTLAAKWPPTMHIDRVISKDHIKNRLYRSGTDFLVFRALNLHGFFSDLKEKNLYAGVYLPSQIMLLCASDKPHRLLAMLFTKGVGP